MSNPMVRVTGTVTGVHGMGLTVAVDHDAVKIAGVALDTAGQEEFAQLYVAASFEARANAERMRLDAALAEADTLNAAGGL